MNRLFDSFSDQWPFEMLWGRKRMNLTRSFLFTEHFCELRHGPLWREWRQNPTEWEPPSLKAYVWPSCWKIVWSVVFDLFWSSGLWFVENTGEDNCYVNSESGSESNWRSAHAMKATVQLVGFICAPLLELSLPADALIPKHLFFFCFRNEANTDKTFQRQMISCHFSCFSILVQVGFTRCLCLSYNLEVFQLDEHQVTTCLWLRWHSETQPTTLWGK